MNKVLKLEKNLSWGGLSQVLVKVLGFQLCGRDNPQNDTMPSFFMIQGALYIRNGTVWKLNEWNLWETTDKFK